MPAPALLVRRSMQALPTAALRRITLWPLTSTTDMAFPIQTSVKRTGRPPNSVRRRHLGRTTLRTVLPSSSSYSTMTTDTPFSTTTSSTCIHIDKRIHRTETVPELFQIYERSHAQFNHRNWASLMNQLKKKLRADASSVGGEEHWKNNIHFHRLLQTLETVVTNTHLPTRFQPQTMANIVHALAKLNVRNTAILDSLHSESAWFIEMGEPQHIANAAWSFATLRYNAPRFFDQLLLLCPTSKASWLVAHGSPQHIANTAWACATLRHPQATVLLDAIDKNAPTFVPHAKAQELANVAWACGTMNHRAPLLFQHMQEYAVTSRLVQTGTSQAIANTAWACATLGHSCNAFFRQVDSEASQSLLQRGKSQEVANVAWAFATLGLPAPKLFRYLDTLADRFVTHATPQEMANVAWACATLRYKTPALLQRIDQNSAKLVESGTTQGIANTAWAFAQLGMVPSELFGHLTTHMDQFLESAKQQHICNTLWALSVLDLGKDSHAPLMQRLWNRMLQLDASNLLREELTQLAYVDVYATANGIQLLKSHSLWRHRIKESFHGQTKSQSRFEDEYSSLLHQIGFDHEREFLVVEPILQLDFANQPQKIAVEYDGEYHYVKNVRERELQENGRTRSKRRLLQTLGWKVVNIPYFDDMNMNKEASAADRRNLKKRYLKNKLTEVGAFFPED